MTDAPPSSSAEPQPRLRPDAGAEAHTPAAAGARVLLVEDEDVVRGMLVRALSAMGFQVFTASDGDLALELLARCEVDIVVSDIAMPRLSGIELMRSIATRWPHVRRLLVTGSVDVPPGVPAGVPVVGKPFVPHELALRIREMLRAAT